MKSLKNFFQNTIRIFFKLDLFFALILVGYVSFPLYTVYPTVFFEVIGLIFLIISLFLILYFKNNKKSNFNIVLIITISFLILLGVSFVLFELIKFSDFDSLTLTFNIILIIFLLLMIFTLLLILIIGKDNIAFLFEVKKPKYETDKETEELRMTTATTLKNFYYFTVVLAVTTILSNSFVHEDGNFIGLRFLNDVKYIVLIFLFFTFSVTIVRFVHGATIHLMKIPYHRTKVILDIMGFYLQGSIFYLMAISVNNINMFFALLGLMLFLDAIWIVILIISKINALEKVCIQWFVSDLIMILIIDLLIVYYPLSNDFQTGMILLIVASIAAILDYTLNFTFYFGKKSKRIRE